jgi:hypothetical protein
VKIGTRHKAQEQVDLCCSVKRGKGFKERRRLKSARKDLLDAECGGGGRGIFDLKDEEVNWEEEEEEEEEARGRGGSTGQLNTRREPETEREREIL